MVDPRVKSFAPGVVERLRCDLLLTSKVPVDSAFFEAGRLHQIGQGGSVITPLIKDRRRLANDFLPCLFAFPHIATLANPCMRPISRLLHHTRHWMGPVGL